MFLRWKDVLFEQQVEVVIFEHLGHERLGHERLGHGRLGHGRLEHAHSDGAGSGLSWRVLAEYLCDNVEPRHEAQDRDWLAQELLARGRVWDRNELPFWMLSCYLQTVRLYMHKLPQLQKIKRYLLFMH